MINSSEAHPNEFETIARRLVEYERLADVYEIDLTFTEPDEMRELNNRTRGVDSVTDVLSYPSGTYRKGTARDCVPQTKTEYNDETRRYSLGSIAICRRRAWEQATEYGHSYARELCYLFAHGVCHLLGYDHDTPEKKGAMRIAEEASLSGIDLDKIELDYIDLNNIKLNKIELNNIELNNNNNKLNNNSVNGIAVSPETEAELIRRAKQASGNAYAKYSNYNVGACLLTDTGEYVSGCNVENASYGLSMCAERNAVFAAVARGMKRIKAIAIYASGDAPYPCGACRQVLSEFGDDALVIVATDAAVSRHSLHELLPHGFRLGGR